MKIPFKIITKYRVFITNDWDAFQYMIRKEL
jgi:hypothetical protein